MKKLINIKILFALFLLVGFTAATVQEAKASHLRGVSISWTPTGNPGEVEFRFLFSERQTWVNQTLGSTYSVGIDFGDGTSGNATGPITSINTTEDYMVADLKVRHTYAGNGPYTAQYSVCCRIGGLGNGGSTLTLQTIVTPRNGNNSPTASIPTVITVPSVPLVTFSIPASDVDGDRLRYRFANTNENGGMSVPSGMTIDQNTGVVTWNTSSYSAAQISAGSLFAAQVMVEDLDGNGNVKSKTPVDFIIKFVGNIGTPPTLSINPAGPLTVSANSPVSFSITGNDADANARVTLNAAGVPAGAAMTPAIGAQLSPPVTSTFNWTPTLAQAGPNGNTYVINFTATDENNNQALKSITINVLPVGAPTASSQSISAQAGVPQTVVLQATDPNGLNLTFSITGAPVHGTAILDGSPTCAVNNGVSTCSQNVIYTANTGYSGLDSFTYRANNGIQNSNAANVTATVTSNVPPVANTNAYLTDEDTVLTVPAPGVLSNDTDADNSPLTAVLVSSPSHAAAFSLNSNGSFNYTPAANFNGSDSFSYKANDGQADSNTVTVTITINAVNDAPVANNDSYSTNEDTALSVPASGVIVNDADADNDSLTATLVSGPSNAASFTLNSDGSFSYTPATNFNGSDSFTYTVSDSNLTSNTATVSITVNAINDAPVAVNNSYSVNEDASLSIAAPGVVGNDMDVENSPLTAALVFAPSNAASFTLNADGSFSYTPNANFNGSDSFTYKASDGSLESSVATVQITVNPVNDNPDAVNDSATVAEDSSATIVNVRANDLIAPDTGETLTVAAVTQGANGAVAITGGGTGVSYAPNANYFGSDSFTYTISDGNGGTDTATVNVTVTPVNDNPDAVNDSPTVAEDSAANAINVRANDSIAPDTGETLTVTAVTQGAKGAVAITGGGTGVSYTPNANFFGADSFTYTISDGNGGSDTATVNVTVTNVNDNPTANNDAATIAEDSGANPFNVLANDSILPDANETLVITNVTQGANGSVAILNNGANLSYTPAANYFGADSFTYTISDGNGGTASATVNVTVTGVNDAPVAANDTTSVNEDATLNIIAPGVIGNDSDIENNALTAAIVAAPANAASFALNPNGSFSYTPKPNYNGSDSFTYKVSDGSLNSNTATVSITVNPVNDNPSAANDSPSVAEDSGANVIEVLANDSILPDAGETLTVTGVTQGAKGSVAITNGGANVSYTPNANYFGADSFSYTISDGNGGTASATVNVNVTNVNDNPTASNDAATIAEDSGANTFNVLSNDSILPDAGETLTISGVTQGANGSVAITNGGTRVSYTTAANYFGSDSFTYAISDGNGGTASATVNVTVTAVNDAPIISGTSINRQQATPGIVSTIATVADVDNAAGSLAVSVTSLPAGITVTGITNTNGTINATVTVGCGAAVGANTVGLKVTDGAGAMATANLTVNVNKETTPPVIGAVSNITVNLPESSTATSTAVTFSLPSVSDNCPGATVMATPASGSQFNIGTTTVNVKATDAMGNTATKSFTVTVLYQFKFFDYSDLLSDPNYFIQATAGSDIQVRFTLSGFKGNNPYSSNPAMQRISCTNKSPIGAAQQIQTVGGVVNYSSMFDVYTSVWRTQAAWVGQCRRVTLSLKDGTTKSLDFFFK